MKIAVIGKGTASIITSLNMLERGHDVTIFFDPNTPHLNVGESTTPIIGSLLYRTLGLSIHEMVRNGIFSYKMGINFQGWGKSGNFYHDFDSNGMAHHFETVPFNSFIHDFLEKKKVFEYIAERVDGIEVEDDGVIVNNRVFDFVINCAGWSSDFEYETPSFETVNSAVTFKKKYDYADTHTLHLATEDGWQFGLPFPQQGIFKCGYLYNKNQISEDEVREKLKDEEIAFGISWTPKYAPVMLDSPRSGMNGNRLFFFEPLQALSLHYVNTFSEMMADYLDEPTLANKDLINTKYRHEIWSYELSLAFHYSNGSIHDSAFWADVEQRAKAMFGGTLNGRPSSLKHNVTYDALHVGIGNGGYSKIGIFEWPDVKTVYEGMTGDKF